MPTSRLTTPDERLRAKLQSERRRRNNGQGGGASTDETPPSQQQFSPTNSRPTNNTRAQSSDEVGVDSRTTSRSRPPNSMQSSQAAAPLSRPAAGTYTMETPFDRLRQKLSSQESARVYSPDSGRRNRANVGSDDNHFTAGCGSSGGGGASASGGNADNLGYVRSNAQQLEDRVRQKAATAKNSHAYAGTHAERLEDRVIQKANGRAADAATAATALSTTASAEGKHTGGGGNPRVSYISGSGIAQARKTKVGLDPRASAVGAYSVQEGGRDGPRTGRGGKGGRLNNQREGRSYNNGRGGWSGRDGVGRGGRGRGRGHTSSGRDVNGSDGGSRPSIFGRHTPQNEFDVHSVAAPSTITTRPAPADRERRNRAPEQELAPLSEERNGPEKNYCGLSRSNMLIIGGVVLLALVGAGVGAAAATEALNSSPSPSSAESASPPTSQAPPVSRPTSAPLPPPEDKPRGPECELTKLPGSDTGRAGSSVATSGDIIGVGSFSADTTGSVIIYERSSDDVWVETTTIRPSDGMVGDLFGRAIDLEDDILVIGSTYNDSDTTRGCVYVFSLSEDGNWVQQAKLIADDPFLSDSSFGSSVALGFVYDGGLERRIQCLIGEPFGEFYPIGERSGSVHVFTDTTSGGWMQLATLLPRDGQDGDSFGRDVDLSSGRAVVAGYEGSAYTFEQDINRLSRWDQRTKIPPLDDPVFGVSGSSVSIYHRTFAVGSGGSVRIFDFSKSDELGRIRPEDSDVANLAFGQDVALKDDTIVVSAPPIGSAGGVEGAVYVFQGLTGRSTQRERYDGIGGKSMVYNVAVDRSTVAIGSPGGGTYIAELC